MKGVFRSMSTICAVSTPLAQGGLSVIRISGDKAIEIAEKIFCRLVIKKLKLCLAIPVYMEES